MSFWLTAAAVTVGSTASTFVYCEPAAWFDRHGEWLS